MVAAGFMPAPSDVAALAKTGNKQRKAIARRTGAAETGPGFREFVSPNGFRVLVGRNNRCAP